MSLYKNVLPKLVMGLNGAVVYATGKGDTSGSFDGIIVKAGDKGNNFYIGQKIKGWKAECFTEFKGTIVMPSGALLKNI